MKWRECIGNDCNICGTPEGTKPFNLLKPTGHVMHHKFNIQQLYVLHAPYLCVLYLSEKKQRLVPLKCSILITSYKVINPLHTKRRLLYLKAQSVPRYKYFSSRL